MTQNISRQCLCFQIKMGPLWPAYHWQRSQPVSVRMEYTLNIKR